MSFVGVLQFTWRDYRYWLYSACNYLECPLKETKYTISHTHNNYMYMYLSSLLSLQFLRRYRVDSLHLAPSTLNQILSLFQSREQLINGQYGIVESRQAEELDGMSTDSDEMKVVVTKCHSTITCSSSESNVFKYVCVHVCMFMCVCSSGCGLMLCGCGLYYVCFLIRLTDGNTDSYWQSNGSPRTHWIRYTCTCTCTYKRYICNLLHVSWMYF